MGGSGFGAAYDLLYNDMTTAEPDIVRTAIANDLPTSRQAATAPSCGRQPAEGDIQHQSAA